MSAIIAFLSTAAYLVAVKTVARPWVASWRINSISTVGGDAARHPWGEAISRPPSVNSPGGSRAPEALGRERARQLSRWMDFHRTLR